VVPAEPNLVVIVSPLPSARVRASLRARDDRLRVSIRQLYEHGLRSQRVRDASNLTASSTAGRVGL
jgi:hypothetical protein